MGKDFARFLGKLQPIAQDTQQGTAHKPWPGPSAQRRAPSWAAHEMTNNDPGFATMIAPT
jgi:hypothetical protein